MSLHDLTWFCLGAIWTPCIFYLAWCLRNAPIIEDAVEEPEYPKIVERRKAGSKTIWLAKDKGLI